MKIQFIKAWKVSTNFNANSYDVYLNEEHARRDAKGDGFIDSDKIVQEIQLLEVSEGGHYAYYTIQERDQVLNYSRKEQKKLEELERMPLIKSALAKLTKEEQKALGVTRWA